MEVPQELRALFKEYQLPNDNEIEIATFKVFFYPNKFFVKKKKERCLMITESKLRILTNNPRSDRNRDEIVKKRQALKNICALTTSANSNQIIIHFHQNIDETDWQIECAYYFLCMTVLVYVFGIVYRLIDYYLWRGLSENPRQIMQLLPESKKEEAKSAALQFKLDSLLKVGEISISDKIKVHLVKHNESTSTRFALKEIKVADCHGISQKVIESVRDNTFKLKHIPKISPFVVPLFYTSGKDNSLYFLMPYFNKGDLHQHLSIVNCFSEEQVKFFAIEICLALDDLHSRSIVYKDLIPENVLLSEKGHICLTDFGNARFNIETQPNTPTTSVGNQKIVTISDAGPAATPQSSTSNLNSISTESSTVSTIITCYTAPEILLGGEYTKQSDYWCLGVLLYELLTGMPPFFSDDLAQQYALILDQNPVFPNFLNISAECKDFILQLLQKTPSERLGSNNGLESVMNHPWVETIQNFDEYRNLSVQPPYVPHVAFETQFVRIVPAPSE